MQLRCARAIVNLCTFNPPTAWGVMSERGDADCAIQTHNGVKSFDVNMKNIYIKKLIKKIIRKYLVCRV